MSDATSKNALSADVRAKSVAEDQLSEDNSSHDLWEWDLPTAATPALSLRSGWDLTVNGDLSVSGDTKAVGGLIVGAGTEITKITIASTPATGGSDGDVWLQYHTT